MKHPPARIVVTAALALVPVVTGCQPGPSSSIPEPQTVSPEGLSANSATPMIIETDRPSRLSAGGETPSPIPGSSEGWADPPIGGIAPHGPYLAYFRIQSGEPTLFLINEDGSGGRFIRLPPDATLPLPSISALSPDSAYLAFYTGSAGQVVPGDRIVGPFDLRLNVMRLADNAILYALPTISSAFPDNFASLAESQALNPPEGYEGSTIPEMIFGFHQAFIHGSRYIAWSPSGSTLAFPAQIDGPSSDLYTLDVGTGQVKRLSSGSEQLYGIHWSPDARWIVHGSATWVGMGDFLTFHAVRSDGSRVLTFLHSGQEFGGWIRPDTFLTYQAANGIGEYNLRSIALPTGKAVDIWPHPFSGFATDPLGSQLVIGTFGELEGEPTSGTYLIDTSTSSYGLLSATPLFQPTPWPSSEFAFVASSLEGGTFAITPELDLVKIEERSLRPIPSPDGQFLALFASRDGLTLLDKAAALVGTIDDPAPDRVMWSPDSKGIFILSDDFLYYASVATLRPIVVDTGFESSYFFPSFAWVAGE